MSKLPETSQSMSFKHAPGRRKAHCDRSPRFGVGRRGICSDLFRFPRFLSICSFDLFRFALLVFSGTPRFLPICSDMHSWFSFFREYPDLFRFAPFSSDLFRFAPICSDLFRFAPFSSDLFRFAPFSSDLFRFVSEKNKYFLLTPFACPRCEAEP